MKFKNLAIQKVGHTAVIPCLYEAESGIMRIDPNPQFIDGDAIFIG
ncbi:MAG: hypothetical protein U5R30_10405 [Deltaproteobacteria bacterium]|nr:hypothetical protein [Deltaproteobacteria bacterium]